ncbi:MAG TPA: LURP-one-related family protein [Verrucomicrobiae bacterium]
MGELVIAVGHTFCHCSNMQYVMKEKWLAPGNDFAITDNSGREVYYVDGRAFSLGDKLSFRDAGGREVAFIRQRLLSWGPTYEVTRDGQHVATVKKKLFTLLRHRFSVDVPGPNDLEAKGDFFEHEYEFLLRDRAVAQVSKRWISLTDSYGIKTAEGADDILILCCAVVIDLVCHEGKDH